MAGLRRRLERHDKIATETQCRRLLDATGGWPALVDEAFKRCGGYPDIQAAADDVRADVDNGGPLAGDLISRVGLEASPRARAMLDFVRDVGGLAAADVLPELIDPSLTPLECQALIDWLSRLSLLVSREGRWVVDPLIARVLSAG
jgi:hypothetical protein